MQLSAAARSSTSRASEAGQGAGRMSGETEAEASAGAARPALLLACAGGWRWARQGTPLPARESRPAGVPVAEQLSRQPAEGRSAAPRAASACAMCTCARRRLGRALGRRGLRAWFPHRAERAGREPWPRTPPPPALGKGPPRTSAGTCGLAPPGILCPAASCRELPHRSTPRSSPPSRVSGAAPLFVFH